MASRMAVHWRAGPSEKDSCLVFFISMVTCIGGPFRVFELLGLQQPFKAHVIVSLFYLAVHTPAVMIGARLAYSNAMFYLAHEVYDTMNAVVDMVLSGLAGIPTHHDDTCSR
eukprot:gene4101-4347_t